MKWRHLIRRPAKLTGPRHELCTWGEPTRPGVGSLSRRRYTQGTLNKTGRGTPVCSEHGKQVKTGRRPIMEEAL
jgi:hypothetical protein